MSGYVGAPARSENSRQALAYNSRKHGIDWRLPETQADMDFFNRQDVEQIVALLSQAGDPTTNWPFVERKRHLLEGTARLVGAEIWYWGIIAINATVQGDAMPNSFIDGGWRDEEQRVRFYEFLTNPELGGRANARGTEVHRSQTHQTLFQREMYEQEKEVAGLLKRWHAYGFGDCLISIYPVSPDISSCIALYRRSGQPLFTERDRAIVHLVLQQVDWLHREGLNVPAGTTVLELSPRERQVLILLLGGDSQKEVAKKLGLSVFTVGDYVKKIYLQLRVNSRAELLATFISGGQRRAP